MCDQTFKNISCQVMKTGSNSFVPCLGLLVSEKPWYHAVWRMNSLFSCWIFRFFEMIVFWGTLCKRSATLLLCYIFLKQYAILHNYWVQNWPQLVVALVVQEDHILTIFGVLKNEFCFDHEFSNKEFCIFWYISHFFTEGNGSEIALIDALTTDASSTLLRAGS